MPIYSRRNQYRGVNPHLHSYYQAQGGWEGFHNAQVFLLATHINAALPPGYVVDSVLSLDLGEDAYLTALVIYQITADALLGQPVTRLELLSPSNKQGDGYTQYREKRAAALRAGLCLVEVDYLHETPSPVKGLARYPADSAAHPYTIAVSNPTPSFDAGTVMMYGVGVDESLPTIDLPLLPGDSVQVDFDAAYQQVFSSLTAYSLRADYAQPPLHLDRYSARDQQRIAQRMLSIADAVQRGVDLEASALA
ncbi:MAG: DUF4058 family protein [Armatimonadetes bacterium]|nr:DUF4058 family protein [Anaerolineae bacterium]